MNKSQGASIALMVAGLFACNKQEASTNTPEATEPAATEPAATEQADAGHSAADLCGKPPTPEELLSHTHVCLAGNACKGQGVCKTEANDCRCYNECKGKAVSLVKSEEECTSAGGQVVKTTAELLESMTTPKA